MGKPLQNSPVDAETGEVGKTHFGVSQVYLLIIRFLNDKSDNYSSKTFLKRQSMSGPVLYACLSVGRFLEWLRALALQVHVLLLTV